MKTKITTTLLTLATLLSFAGCANTPATRIAANPQLFASIAPAGQNLIRQGQIAIGFTPNMVLLALGEPDIVTRHADANGSTETWRYQSADPNTRATVYMGWGGPYLSPRWGSYGYWGGWWGPSTYWDWQPARTDYLRVTFSNGRATEINQLR